VPIGDERMQLEWRDFGDFPAEALYELLRFRQAIFVVEQSSPYPDLDDLDQCAHHLLLRIGGGGLAGYARVIPDPSHANPLPQWGRGQGEEEGERRVAIGRVAVAAEWRRLGLARLLMAEALARCGRDYPGCPIALSAQIYLVPFYEGLGFRAAAPPYDDYGVPHVDMVCLPERRADA
jgi:ElaA protein